MKSSVRSVTDNDITLRNNNSISVVDLNPDISRSIKVTIEMVNDCVYLSHKQFKDRYTSKLLRDSVLSIDDIYYSIRELIVDNAIPISPSISNIAVPKQQKEPTTPSRSEQIKELLSRGISSPTLIAKELGMNPSYVIRLLKQLK